jgi:hypothetical protein
VLDIPDEVRNTMDLVFIRRIDELLDQVLEQTGVVPPPELKPEAHAVPPAA